jgi:hypothetical protein
MGQRDVIDLSDVPKVNVERQAVGPCNIPMYNFDLCHDQVNSQTVKVVSSIPSPGGKCSLNDGDGLVHGTCKMDYGKLT